MKKVNKATLWPVGHMSLYKFIHFTLFTVLRIWAALRSLVLTIVDVVDSYTGVTPTLLSEVCVLPKLPKHISFMLTSAEADSNVISSAARLISYSVLSGIPYVSVYDPEGMIQSYCTIHCFGCSLYPFHTFFPFLPSGGFCGIQCLKLLRAKHFHFCYVHRCEYFEMISDIVG